MAPQKRVTTRDVKNIFFAFVFLNVFFVFFLFYLFFIYILYDYLVLNRTYCMHARAVFPSQTR